MLKCKQKENTMAEDYKKKNQDEARKKSVKMKMLPHSIESEQAVLGCCLIDEEAPLYITGALKEEDFYADAHKHIFSAIINLYKNSKPIDFVTLVDELENSAILELVGGIDYITTLTNIIPSAANYKSYVDIVKRTSVLRQIISAGQKIIENAYVSESKDDSVDYAEKLIFEIAQKEEQSSLQHIGPALGEVIQKFDDLAKNKTVQRGIKTGFKDFDAITNGLQNSDLILLAARPGVGKSSFAMNIITNAAINEGKKCAIFSLEMPAVQIAQRSLCSVASVSMEKALKGQLNEEEWKSLWVANKKLAEAGIYVDDNSMNNPLQILSKCRRLKREKGLDLIMIDYLQLMSNGSKTADNRQQEISEMTRFLKIAARELNVPIILLSQLSRAVEQRKGDHRPVLSDLRESGAIEQDADIVLFIYKPDMYSDIVNEDEPGICELIVAKHRNGSQGTVKLRWVGEYTTFVDRDRQVKKPQENGIRVVADNYYGDIPPEDTDSAYGDIPPEDLQDLKNKFDNDD